MNAEPTAYDQLPFEPRDWRAIVKICLLALAAILAMRWLCGCGTMAGYEYRQNRNLVRVTHLSGGEPAVGIDLAGDWQGWVAQLAGIGADATAAIAGYKLYERATSGSSAQTVTLPTTITTGNNSPVTITVGRRK